ncbi:MAG: hypothetical protein DMG57_14080 [Acidobacteria bacterium]|nr:MAG: hypothetical protein DMG57_14080 [Acidobacteriota bacterium]
MLAQRYDDTPGGHIVYVHWYLHPVANRSDELVQLDVVLADVAGAFGRFAQAPSTENVRTVRNREPYLPTCARAAAVDMNFFQTAEKDPLRALQPLNHGGYFRVARI